MIQAGSGFFGALIPRQEQDIYGCGEVSTSIRRAFDEMIIKVRMNRRRKGTADSDIWAYLNSEFRYPT